MRGLQRLRPATSPRLHLLRFAVLLPVAFLGCADGESSPGVSSEPTPASELQMSIWDARIEDRELTVLIRIDRRGGDPVEPASLDLRWTLAVYAPDEATGASTFRSLLTRRAAGAFGSTDQPTAESGGQLETTRDGVFAYTYQALLPEGFDPAATYRVGVWNQPSDDEELIGNATFDFVPALGTPQPADGVSTEACNACHDPLEAHGGARREASLCITCHTTQLFDPDTEDPAHPGEMNPLAFTTLIHRIHEGVELPTLVAARQAGIVGAKYSVIGFMSREHVFAETVPDGLDRDPLPELRGIEFPQDIRNCETCHQGAPLADRWRAVISRPVCVSCHTATWFGSPSRTPPLHRPHEGGPIADDRLCETCHSPSDGEFDLSIEGAHTVPTRSEALRGLEARILSVEGSAGRNPTVTFQLRNGDGSPIASLDDLGVVAITVSGPTSGYLQQNTVRQDPRGAARPLGDGAWLYTFDSRPDDDPWLPDGPTILPDAAGTFAVGVEARRTVEVAPGIEVEEAANNPIFYFSVDGSSLEPYRRVVDLDRCDRCHQELRAHGRLRRNPEYCVLCHTADATDWVERPKVDVVRAVRPLEEVDISATPDRIEERSIRFPVLIHRIHTGEDLEQTVPFVVYGFMGRLFDFSDVRFPGDRSRCTTCHLDTTFTLGAVPAGAPPTTANETSTVVHLGTRRHPADARTVPVIQSLCLSCHDTAAAAAHARLQTIDGVESCEVCHGDDREFSVVTVHRR